MMRKVTIFSLCFIFFLTPVSYCNTIDDTVNNELIIELTNKYILLLQQTINQKSDNWITSIDLCFEDYTANDHTYDLSEKTNKMMVGAYLFEAKNDTKIIEFDALTEELEILPCTYFDSKTSKQYAYVKIPKVMIRKGNVKNTYAHYLAIDITNQNYLIEAIYKDDIETQQRYITPCMKASLDAERQKELAKNIADKYKIVGDFYAETNYLEALITIEEILELNNQHIESIDAKKAILDLIEPKSIENKITAYLDVKNISSAKTTLALAQINGIGSKEEQNQWSQKIKIKEATIKQEFAFNKAESYFNNEMFQQALPIYLELQENNFTSEILQSRIKICKEADPEFVQKKIKEAYNIAVKSNGKRANETFKIYYKFENSGYLNGDNFKFMCQIMLSRGNKALLKEMNISSNQAKNLAINYFYKAKNLGQNVEDIEHTIFTKNFDKKRKN